MALIESLLASAEISYTPKHPRQNHLRLSLQSIADLIDGDFGVRVGWFDDGNNYDTGVPVYQVASLNEYGGEGEDGNTIPPRPFMRPALDGECEKWQSFIKKEVIKELQKGKEGDLRTAFEKLGIMVQADIQEYIHKVTSPPLAKYTIEKRAAARGLDMDKVNKMDARDYNNLTKPLEDTGQMISTVTFKVYGGEK